MFCLAFMHAIAALFRGTSILSMATAVGEISDEILRATVTMSPKFPL